MTGDMIGKVFNNRYQITERIGIGGMAEVYRAQDNVLGRIVAVKIMLPQYAADPSFTQRFKHEAAAAANLQNPYIVNVYDWGQDEGIYYIVMEYIRGSDLKTAINERGAINQRKVAEIGSQVCQALGAAHRLDIIHRDIKPQNIMVQPDGNVKVMDFGIARAKNSVKTQTSSVLGTAHYISPEQAQGKELTATSDIYSLGIVLYEAATGCLPFDGPDAISVAMMQVNDLPAPPHELNPDIDPVFESIVMKAMSKAPTARFATANDMKQALNDYLAGRPVNLGGFGGAETAVLGGMAGAGMGTMSRGVMADGTSVMPAMNSVKPATPTTNYRAGGDSNKKGPNKKAIGIAVGVIAAIILVVAIALAVTSGSGTGEAIPDVKNKTVAEATTILEGAGFKIGKTVELSDAAIEKGKVISTDPPADNKSEKGTTVNLNVSKGPEQVTVPDLVGKKADEAKKLLAAGGLVGEAGPAAYSSEVAKDHVIEQGPPAGEMVSKGATITYVLSLGTESLSVPNVVGSGEGSAEATLVNAGFVVTKTYETNDSVAEGMVISQSPNADSKLTKGGTVNIAISSGKKAPSSFPVSASANTGGTVSPSSMNVDAGGSVTFTVTTNDGYQVASINDTNGATYTVSATGGTFTIKNVSNEIAVTVTFSQKTPATPDPETKPPAGDGGIKKTP